MRQIRAEDLEALLREAVVHYGFCNSKVCGLSLIVNTVKVSAIIFFEEASFFELENSKNAYNFENCCKSLRNHIESYVDLKLVETAVNGSDNSCQIDFAIPDKYQIVV